MKSRRIRLYNAPKNNIIYINENANSEFWDSFWNQNGEDWIENYTKKKTLNDVRFRLFKKYLFKGAQILEGGCGRGQFVYGLSKLGFRCTGIDYAENTVKILNEHLPELDIKIGDITNLNEIPDSSYDGYYSGGVIEHFWDGYNDILSEMLRVLKNQGILIITFPFMSHSRKEEKKMLPIYNETNAPKGFYQFALDIDDTLKDFQEIGFELLYTLPINGYQGFLERYPNNRIISRLQNYKGNNFIFRRIRSKTNYLLTKLGYGHTILMVLKVNK